MLQLLQPKVKAKSNNSKQTTTQRVVHSRRGIGIAHKLVEKIQKTGFYPAIKGKRKTEEEKERGILQPSIHQKKDKLELCIISLILYLKSNHKWTG